MSGVGSADGTHARSCTCLPQRRLPLIGAGRGGFVEVGPRVDESADAPLLAPVGGQLVEGRKGKREEGGRQQKGRPQPK